MRSYLSSLAIVVSTVGVFATDARVETMGGTHNFFKDDQSIFVNPATIGDYDRMLMGSYGIYTEEATDGNIVAQYNRDARKPNFGATVSFGKSEADKSKFSIGAMFNRYDPMLRYITPGKDFIGNPAKVTIVDTVSYIDELVGKTDLLAGYTLKNGFTIGMGGYFAFQSNKEDNVEKALTQLVKGSLGVSGPVSDNMDLEASVAVGTISLKGLDGASTTIVAADKDMVLTADVRAFADLPAINGKFVPHIQANVVKHHKDETIVDFNGGIGFNANIDRGFLWGGFEGLYLKDSYSQFKNFYTLSVGDSATGERSRIGGRVSFGIERNILTDWLVWRVGGSKLLAYEKLNDGNLASYWVENSEDDHVSFGMGVNIEDRFRVDAVVAENMLYTFSNLFSGNSHHFSSKISATFSF